MTLFPPAEIALADEAATAQLGAAVGRLLGAGEAVCLWGPLGAGKSTLARGLIRSLTRPDEDVPSPTFTLVQFYRADRLALAHFDLYRLAGPQEVHEIGLDEALEDGAAIIEWPERLEGRLPPDRLDIALRSPVGADARIAALSAHGRWEGRGLEV